MHIRTYYVRYVSFIHNEHYHTVHTLILLNYIRKHINKVLLQIKYNY